MAVDKEGFIYVLDNPGITKLAPSGELVQTIALENYNGGKSMGVDAAGNLYVCNYTYSRIEKYSPTGRLLLQFGSSGRNPGQFIYPNSITVDADGNIYVADTANNRLQKFDTNGKLLFVYSETGTTSLLHPMDVALDAIGNIYIYNEDFKVTKLSAAGALLQTIPVAASRPSYDEAATIAIDPAGNIYVTSSEGSSILKFTSTGTYVGPVGAYLFDGTLTPLAFDPAGNLYATNRDHHGNSKLHKFNPTGNLVGTWGNLKTLGPGAFDVVGNYYYYDSRLLSIGKYNAMGQLIGQLGVGVVPMNVKALALDLVGNIYMLTNANEITKMTPDGRQLARFTVLKSTIGYESTEAGMAVDAAGNIYVTDYYGGCVRKLGPQGQLLPNISTRGTGAGQLLLPKSLALDGRGFIYVTDNNGKRVQQFTPNGQLVRELGERVTAGSSQSEGWVKLAVDKAGNAYVSSPLLPGVQVYDAKTGMRTSLPQIYQGQLAISHRSGSLVSILGDLIRFYTSDQAPKDNLITGNIFQDLNSNCARDAGELALPNMAVVAQPGNYYGLTDENGQYTIAVGAGTYTVEQLVPSPEPGRTITPLCSTPATLVFQGYGSSKSGPDFGNLVSTKPFLRVNIASNRRRRCFRNTTTVSYSNSGYAAAPNATVTVAFPPEVVLVAAGAPYTRDAAGNYVFQVGTLLPNAAGTIVLQDSVVCGNPDLRGLTVCTKAWIAPLNVYPAPASATGPVASVAVQGRTQANNQARFVVRNTTSVDMRDSLALRVYQNSELALQHRYWLAGGDSLVLRVPASRPVVRVEADQPTGHPTQRIASSTVEVRSLSATGEPNSDMLALPPNTPRPEIAEDCKPILDSYDPNDKQVVPAGVTAQHYTPTGVPLQYEVRFQNTGSDDAYRVEVVDTLASDLDLRTLRVTAASHPYRLAVTGHGRPVLTFTFLNINLPPSKRDAVGSNGFVQFSVQPKAGLPAKALIENNADIFFDYNPPIRTNTTTNRIYDLPLEVEPAVALTYPTVLASPSLLQFTPAQGKAGTLVTLTGQRFSSSVAANAVLFNGVPTSVLSTTATTLTVRVPATATTGSIQVVTKEGAGRSQQAFTVYQPPTLTAMMPPEGTPGSVVRLRGSHFANTATYDTVWFNGVPAVVQQATATELQVVVPSSAQSGKVRINTLGGQTESAQEFVVWYPPVLTSFSPARGKAGGIVTVTGSRFAPTERNTVLVGGGAATVLEATSSSLRVRVPSTAQTGLLQITTPGGQALSTGLFTFLPPPTITSFAPTQGSVGETLALTGLNFLVDGLADTVYVGGIPAPVLTATPTTATIRVPKGATSGPITISGKGGRNQTASPFTLVALTAAESIAVYPNPAHGAVTLDWLRADFAVEQVQVYNALGKLVTSVDLHLNGNTSLSLPFAAGETGLYLLVFHTARGPVLKRITLY
ncbi:hypothetical protein GCM10011383_23520 [Hymenobacter cavernae]|uniref:IPT/TIG domain-containing protein n=1 Tax=Hymenobacter cavernae TaxID=2044852 RepID=A0ABQ1U9F0_9BACT|nr:hypothetical protein GCM10011383_23520 [Hymenobacter cavernae]